MGLANASTTPPVLRVGPLQDLPLLRAGASRRLRRYCAELRLEAAPVIRVNRRTGAGGLTFSNQNLGQLQLID